MRNRRHPYLIMLLLLVSMLTNGLGWAFNGQVIAHELDHQHQALSSDPTTHLDAHRHAAIDDESLLDAATHLSLHAAGQYQPFFFTALPPFVPASIGTQVLTAFVSIIIPQSIPDSLLRPPKNILAS